METIQELDNKCAYVLGKPIRSGLEMIKPLKKYVQKNNSAPFVKSHRMRYITADNTSDLKDSKHRELVMKLLEFGGNMVSVPISGDEDIHNILQRGQMWYNDIAIAKVGDPGRCHDNVRNLWKANTDNHERIHIATGYVLDRNRGLWNQHSWMIFNHKDGSSIIETTPIPRRCYFGFVMTEPEAEEFYSYW
jgi:hypothetical protein